MQSKTKQKAASDLVLNHGTAISRGILYSSSLLPSLFLSAIRFGVCRHEAAGRVYGTVKTITTSQLGACRLDPRATPLNCVTGCHWGCPFRLFRMTFSCGELRVLQQDDRLLPPTGIVHATSGKHSPLRKSCVALGGQDEHSFALL